MDALEQVLTPAMAAWRRRRLAGRTVVLMYHEVRPDEEGADAWTVVRASAFRRQMLHLREHFDVVPLEDALTAGPSAARGRRPRAVVTFDDGYAGVRAVVLPIAEELGIPITVYVATEPVETGRPFWYDRLITACLESREPVLDLRGYGLGRYGVGPSRAGARRWTVIQHLLTELKGCPAGQRDELVSAVVTALGAGGPTDRAQSFAPLSRADLETLARSPLVTIGAHTHGHEFLEALDRDAIAGTLRRSRDLLESWTGREVRTLAYPNGSYDQRVLGVVQDLGFSCAVTTVARPWSPEDSPFEIPRIGIGRYDRMRHLWLRLLGLRPAW